jgi:hypothetical protein
MTTPNPEPKLEQRHYDALDATPFMYTSGILNSEKEVHKALDEIPAIVRALVAENERLRDSVIRPGVMRCAKCGFGLLRNNLNVGSGTVSAGDNKTEPCPNGCGPLWPVTWKEYAQQGDEAYEFIVQRMIKAEDERDALKAAQAPAVGDDKRINKLEGILRRYPEGWAEYATWFH